MYWVIVPYLEGDEESYGKCVAFETDDLNLAVKSVNDNTADVTEWFDGDMTPSFFWPFIVEVKPI